jgi:superfamily II DNA or RNA helicase
MIFLYITIVIPKSFENCQTMLILQDYTISRVLEKVSGRRTKVFALIVTQHRLWGTILMPYIIVNESGLTYFRLSESLSPFPNIDTISTLAPEERETVNIINEYSDRNLFKLFSKNSTVKEFLEKVTTDRIDKFIRPFIEARIYKCLSIARDESIPVYLQKGKIVSLHMEDQLILRGDKANPVFRFNRNDEESTYSLSLESAGNEINLRKSEIDIICNSPCLIRESHNIIFITDIDGSKLKPFITKENVMIPKKAEVKYFGSFVLNAVNNFKVEGTGFTISESESTREALIELDISLKGSPVMLLIFNYTGKKIFPTDPSVSFTIFDNRAGEFVFRKYHRDFQWEEMCVKTLTELGFYSDDDVNFSPDGITGDYKEDIYLTVEAINRNWNDLINAGFIITARNPLFNFNLKSVALEISHQIQDDWFDLKAVVRIGEWEIPFLRLRRNILNGIREYELPDGSIAILPSAWFTKYKNIFEFGESTDDTLRIQKHHFSLLATTFDENDCEGCGKLDKLLIPDQIPAILPPPGLQCDMRQYQIDGLSWLHWLQSANLGGCLADDMGLGKTIQTLALLQYNRENHKADDKNILPETPTLFEDPVQKFTSLIVVPASILYNWENEIRRFTPQMKFYCYKGNQRRKSTSYFHHFDIILSSYHTVRQDIDIMSLFKFHYIVLDESQVIKNPASMVFKTMVRLKSDYKLVLTGTPVENSLTDLWTQLNFVNPGLLGSISFFRKEYAKPIEKKRDDDKELQLRKIIKPFILRRTKEMVAEDLPPLTEQTVFCDMTEEQSRVYEEEKSAVRNTILENIDSAKPEKSAIIILQGLMKLRQISNHPVLASEDYPAGSGKFETVLTDMESVISGGHKILVFSSFVKHLQLYAGILIKKRIRYSLLTGSTTNREKTVNGFQNDPSNKIFLISLKAGGVGLNLTSADYVFILDPWWNPAAEMQALNRAHRIGQDKSVFVYRYISSNSIEQKIVKLQERKSKLADTFIHSNNPLKDIDLKHILEIIG